ncbi:protein zwilch homolog [Sycon ciliatum]|uniref:protein zwilch homolog n=1 Tax=Sycon ciliatum TaxID=27933 RepID=UPI0031F6721D
MSSLRCQSQPSLIDSMRCLAADIDTSSCTITKHCTYQEEFLLQFVPPNVAPPLSAIAAPTTRGYVLASSYVPTDGEDTDRPERHQVAGLQSPVTIVQCGGGGSAAAAAKDGDRLQCMPELWHAAKQSDQRVHVSTPLSSAALSPLTADDARYLMSEYSSTLRPGNEALPPLWVLCSPSKPTQLLWLAGQCKLKAGDTEQSDSSPPPSVVPQLLSCRFLGTILRPSSLLDSPTSFYALPSLHKLLSHGCVPLDVDGGLDMQERCGLFTAEYEIIGSLSNSTSEMSMDTSMLDEADLGGSLLVVRYSWERSSTVLCYPTSAASCCVLVRAVSKDLRSPAARLLRELNQLEAWVQLFGLEDSSARVEWRQGDSAAETAVDRTAGFLQKVQTCTAEDLMQWRPDEGRQADLDAISSHMLPLRQDLDFTQLFWLLAKDAVSIKDVSRCLLQVSRCLFKQEIQPMVYRENITALADLVRQCLQCTTQDQLTQVSANVLSATGSSLLRALSVLLQTGFYKLERDFVHFFVSEELATWNQLAPFLITSFPPASSLEQTQGEVFAWFCRQSERLRALHCCLELVMMCRVYLSLPSDSLRMLLRTALEYYAKHSYKDMPVFCLSLAKNAKDCLEICTRNLPSNWSCSVTSRGSRTVLQLSTSPPHASLEEDEVQMADGKALTCFYVTQSVVPA